MSRRSDHLSGRVSGDHARDAVFQHPWMTGREPRWSAVSRISNLLAAFVLMVVLAPLVLVIAVLLRLRQGPGVLTRENRLGLHSIVFRQWAFRVEHPDGASPLVSDASGLQNLPALLNVMTGDMAIFGPRPVCPQVARSEAARDPFYTARFAVKPGLLALEA